MHQIMDMFAPFLLRAFHLHPILRCPLCRGFYSRACAAERSESYLKSCSTLGGRIIVDFL